MAENTSEDLKYAVSDVITEFPRAMAHHDNRDGEEDPVARSFLLTQTRKPQDILKRLTTTPDLCGSIVQLGLP